MNHHEIEEQEIIERYVRHDLKPAERRAFQEHYFDCAQCFEQVQMTAKFIAGVQRAAGLGVLAQSTPEIAGVKAVPWWASLFTPAFALAATACLALAVALGWIVFNQIPKLREDLARERQSREALAQASQQQTRDKDANLAQAQNELEQQRQQLATEKSEREKLAQQLTQIAQNRPSQRPERSDGERVNVPIVLLETQRDAQASSNQLTLPANAKAATLWIELAADARYDSYQLQVFDAGKHLATTIVGAKLNSYGALAVQVPTRLLPQEKYLVKAFGVKGGQRELLGEYDLTVRKR